MFRYLVALCQGGLQEDPHWHHEELLWIEANNRKDAIKRWFLHFRHEECHFDLENETYWGWCIDILKTTDPDCKTAVLHGNPKRVVVIVAATSEDMKKFEPVFEDFTNIPPGVTMTEQYRNWVKDFIEFKCSRCGRIIDPPINEKEYPKYCENCGSKISKFKHRDDL
jgi:DNA-directed RNA polymerase subunit RPC12/RpoP